LRGSSDPLQAGLADIVQRMTGVQGAVLSIQNLISGGLDRRLEQIFRILTDLRDNASNGRAAGAVSELSESVDSLRTRLVEAVSNILDEVQAQHVELARKIQSVFEEQSETATNTVQSSFADEIAAAVSDGTNRERLLARLVEVFMHGMKSMGTYQQINVTEQTEASTHVIRDRISKSIEEVFSGIDKIEEQIIALPLPQPDDTL
jgi:hypothetical protein